MDIANIVNYDQLFELELLHPATEQPTGIKFQIRSSGSEAAKQVARHHLDKNIERRAKNKLVQSVSLEKETLESAAACIASWDWGTNEFKGEKIGTEFSMKKAIEVLGIDWIYTQVTAAANKIENFTPASSTS